MTKLWIVTTGEFDGGQFFIPVIADTTSQLGAYIRNNIPKFMPIFQALFFCDYYYGKIRERLKKWYSIKNFLDIVAESVIQNAFAADIEKILSEFSDEEIIDELWGYNESAESIFVRIVETPIENLMDLRKPNSI